MVHIAKALEYGVEQDATGDIAEDGVEFSLIQEAISKLSEGDYRKLKEWMEEEEDGDREIEDAAESGALDFLIDEVNDAKAKGVLSEL